jgi:hypothetical protein
VNIKTGDIVEYVDAETQLVGKHPVTVKVSKQGIWDGEKVILDDPEKTTVYNTQWLKKVYFNGDKLKEVCKHFGIKYDGTPNQVFVEIPLLIAKKRPFPHYLFPLNHVHHISSKLINAVIKDDVSPEEVLHNIVFKNEVHDKR